MNRHRLSLLLCLLLPLAVGAAPPLYVQAKKAKVMSEPAFTAEVLLESERGAALEVLAEDSRWVKVRSGETEGWVPRLLLGEEPPLEKASVLEDEDVELRHKARRRASATAGTAAARGLRGEDRGRSSEAIRSDYEALEKMEQMGVGEDEARAFVEDESQ